MRRWRRPSNGAYIAIGGLLFALGCYLAVYYSWAASFGQPGWQILACCGFVANVVALLGGVSAVYGCYRVLRDLRVHESLFLLRGAVQRRDEDALQTHLRELRKQCPYALPIVRAEKARCGDPILQRTLDKLTDASGDTRESQSSGNPEDTSSGASSGAK